MNSGYDEHELDLYRKYEANDIMQYQLTRRREEVKRLLRDDERCWMTRHSAETMVRRRKMEILRN